MRMLKFVLGAVCLATVIPLSGLAAPVTKTDFESGTLTGFTFSGQGNAAVIADLGGILPLFGANMAILSNGPGDFAGQPDQAQLLSDPFSLTAADTLNLAIRRL